MLDEPTQVVYVGADAPSVTRRWAGTDRPFELAGYEPSAAPAKLADTNRIDALVCRDRDDVPIVNVANTVRERSSLIPVVVFEEEAIDPLTALEAENYQYIAVDADDETVELLEGLASQIEQRRSQRRELSILDSLLEHIPLSVYVKDRQGRHLRVSDEMTSLLGPPYLENPEGKRMHTPADVVGHTDFDLYPAGLAEDATDDDKTVIESGEPVEDRIEHYEFDTWYDGTYVATSKAPCYDEHGDVLGIVGVTRDISERKQYERRLERQNERLERFAEVLSHDLRNPLEVARGRLELARSGDGEDHFEAIERALERMATRIDEVLTIAKHGETVENPRAIELASVATDAWETVDAAEATLVVEADSEIKADRNRLVRVFENLYRNAVEHAADGSDVTVTIGELTDRDGFFVADDGTGIPDGRQEELFEAGYTTDDGTGLGLNIVRTIADAHGWEINVADDDGARFEFTNVRRVASESTGE